MNVETGASVGVSNGARRKEASGEQRLIGVYEVIGKKIEESGLGLDSKSRYRVVIPRISIPDANETLEILEKLKLQRGFSVVVVTAEGMKGKETPIGLSAGEAQGKRFLKLSFNGSGLLPIHEIILDHQPERTRDISIFTPRGQKNAIPLGRIPGQKAESAVLIVHNNGKISVSYVVQEEGWERLVKDGRLMPNPVPAVGGNGKKPHIN